MESKKAFIYWTHPSQKRLQVGIKYYPHIVRDDDAKRVHWSVQFLITDANQEKQGIIDFTMLADNYEAREFYKTLTSGTQITLFEAYTEVAKGYIV